MPSLILRKVHLAISMCALLLVACFAAAAPSSGASDSLRIYFIDVEGGQSTLFVTPGGHSYLIDAGWGDNNDRDANRILAAAKDAGIRSIDVLLLTHYHSDHAGGVQQLAARIPIHTLVDHGPNRATTSAETQKNWQDHMDAISRYHMRRLIAKPGDVVPVAGLRVIVVSSDGAVLKRPLPGAGKANPDCAQASFPDEIPENIQSVGTVISFGKFRMLDLGDLTASREFALTCPLNKIGVVDVLRASHHGGTQANTPSFLAAIAPRIAVINNAAHKGNDPAAWEHLRHTPGLEDLWQLHYSEDAGPAHNAAEPFLANVSGQDTGYYLKVTAFRDGSFAVLNQRTGKTKAYGPAR